MTDLNDTIAAISTAPGEAGISVVRMSGPLALRIADALIACRPPAPSSRSHGTFLHGTIHSQTDAEPVIDEVIVLIFRAPRSYTRDDLVEIQCHGGRVPARRILAATLSAGARLAFPGEFTQRAFLNGRLDLVQAEAVCDLVRAQSERAAAAAFDQLTGSLSRSLTTCYESLVAVSADLSASLDFADDELETPPAPAALAALVPVLESIRGLLATWNEGRLLRDGALVVISGRPNAGKSTLFNAMVRRDRAIVSPSPGTTRDTIEEHLVLDGYPLTLVDTAGLRDSDCQIEAEGVSRARRKITEADINLHVVDSSVRPDPDTLREIRAMDLSNTLFIINKIDLPNLLPPNMLDNCKVINMSLVSTDVSVIEKRLSDLLTLSPATAPHASVSERHKTLLLQALQSLLEAKELLESGTPEAIPPAVSILREGTESLGRILGRTYDKDLLTSVFSKFCVGK